MMVQLHSLSTTKLNGRLGECGEFNVVKQRYEVALLNEEGRVTTGGDTVGVRPANLCR